MCSAMEAAASSHRTEVEVHRSAAALEAHSAARAISSSASMVACSFLLSAVSLHLYYLGSGGCGANIR